MSSEQAVQDFWNAYLATLPEDHSHRFVPLPDAGSFGNTPEMADRLGDLVVRGIKTATCGRYLGENILEDGGSSMILDSRDEPLCVVETFEVTVRRYRDIDEAWARAEGEGDLSLAYWRKEHWRFFTQEAESAGYEVSENMLLACKRFRVLYPLPE